MLHVSTPHSEPNESRFSFYLLPGFSLQALSSATEALAIANEVLGYDAYHWHVVSEDGGPVTSSCGLALFAETSVRNQRERGKRKEDASVIVVVGGRTLPDANSQLDAWLRESRYRRADLIGILGGTVVLARAGLADGRRCSIHWELYPYFREEFQNVTPTQTAFEQNDGFYSCAGGTIPFDMFMQIIARDHHPATVDRICAKALSLGTRPAGDRQRLPLDTLTRPSNSVIIKIVECMETNITEPLPIDHLAKSVGLSRRQVERAFKKELKCSPSKYYLKLRLEHAHLLIVTSPMPIVEIAIACGFLSASHFSKTYRDRYKRSPKEARASNTANSATTL